MNEPFTNPRPAAQPSRSAPTQVVPQGPSASQEALPAPVHRESPQPFVPPAAQPDGTAAGPRGEAPYVTIVLPCYNEGQHVLQEIERITAAMDASEFTYELLVHRRRVHRRHARGAATTRAHRYPNIRVMPFRRNGGSGTARRIGTQQARGEIVVWTDADMTYPNERIPELVRILRDDDSYDQVVGARTTEEGTHKWARVPAKWVIRKIAERLSEPEDPGPQLRAAGVPPHGGAALPAAAAARVLLRHDDHAGVPAEPARHQVRADRATPSGPATSKFHFVKDAYRYILQVLRMVMYFDPLKVLMPPALWLLAIGVVKAVVDMVRHPFYFPASTVLLIVSGMMIGSLALLADLVVRSRDGV